MQHPFPASRAATRNDSNGAKGERMTGNDTVLVSLEAGVLSLTLNRPDKLNALNLTMPDVFEALERNNENTGGSYIEKGSNLYFIRGIGLVQTLQDIEKIVVTTRNGIPVLVRDVGTVQFGSVNRLGAVTLRKRLEFDCIIDVLGARAPGHDVSPLPMIFS